MTASEQGQAEATEGPVAEKKPWVKPVLELMATEESEGNFHSFANDGLTFGS